MTFFGAVIDVIFRVTGNLWFSRLAVRQAQINTLFSFNLEEYWRKSDYGRKYSGKIENVYYSSVGPALCRVGSSRLCLNEDLRWTPRSPHSAADSPHSHFLRGKEDSSHFFLSLSSLFISPPSPSSSSHHPPQPGRHCGLVRALFDVVLEVNRRGKHLTQLLNREHLNVS